MSSEGDARSISFASMTHEEREVMARRIKRKLDIRIVPACALLWLMAFLDRASVGNANAAAPSISTSLGLQGLQFSTALAVFYILYVIIEIPSNLVLQRVGGKIWLPAIVFGWGVVTIGSGFVRNYGGLIAIRLMLGLCEGGLLPGIVIYMAHMYKRHELSQRIAYFYASASLSGAFGGLLAAGFIQIPRTDTVDAGWRWIFIMEGIITCIVAVIAYILLPTDLKTAECLTPDERLFAQARLYEDYNQGTKDPQGFTNDVGEKGDEKAELDAIARAHTLHTADEKIEAYEVWRTFRDPQVSMTGFGYMCLCVSLYSFSLFIPVIIRGIRPGVSPTQLQLLTVPVYVPATVMCVLMAMVSDRLRVRGPIILCLYPLNIIGYIMLIASADPQVQYAALFLVALGVYPSVPALLAILPNNCASRTKRATAAALQLIIANCAAYPATFIYQAKYAPRYILPHSVVLGFSCLTWLTFLANTLYCAYENKARAAGKRDGNVAKYEELIRSGKSAAPIGDRSPDFRFTI